MFLGSKVNCEIAKAGEDKNRMEGTRAPALVWLSPVITMMRFPFKMPGRQASPQAKQPWNEEVNPWADEQLAVELHEEQEHFPRVW